MSPNKAIWFMDCGNTPMQVQWKKEGRKMKRAILLAALILSVALSIYAQQANSESDFAFTIIDNATAVEITAYVGNTTDVRIPERIQNLPVTHIGSRVFLGREWVEDGENTIFIPGNPLTGISIPDSVTHIGDKAFAGNRLTEVTIPDSVVYIGDGAFEDGSLDHVTISNSVTHIGNFAFAGNWLSYVHIPNSVTHIGEKAFVSNRLDFVIIPNSVAYIGAWAFDANILGAVTLPANVDIQPTSFPAIVYERYIRNGREGATFDLSTFDYYDGHSHFTVTVIDDSIVEITNFVQRNEAVVIPESINGLPVVVIGNEALYRNQLTSVVIPNSVTYIGEIAFADNRLTDVVIPNSVTKIAASAFRDNQLESVTIPDSVTYIGEYAFANNRLIGVSIPSGAFVDPKAFDLGVTVKRRYSPESDFDVSTFNEGVSALLMLYFGNDAIVHIPARIRNMPIIRIGDGAFLRSRLTGVIIAYGIRIIGGGAFAENQLTSVSIPESVTRIEHRAFWDNQLTDVTIPDSVIFIGNQAFQRNLLTGISIPGHTEVHPNAFDPDVTVTRR